MKKAPLSYNAKRSNVLFQILNVPLTILTAKSEPTERQLVLEQQKFKEKTPDIPRRNSIINVFQKTRSKFRKTK
jgi:hypothetical protein